MAVFIDRKYLLMVSVKLDNFKQKKDDLYNFRCPICGDSSKKKTKARGFIYRKDNDYFYKCFNDESCSTTFYKFLEYMDTGLSKEYSMERYRNGDDGHHNYTKPTFKTSRPVFKKKDITLPSIKDLSEDHPAKIYIKERKIPAACYKDLFYAEKFNEFVSKLLPDSDRSFLNDSRIIIPFRDENGVLTHFQGRSITNSEVRYITVTLSESPKLFGLNKLEKNKLVYVLEAPLDSLFIKNAVATADANLDFAIKYFKSRNEVVNTVLIPDIQPRNKNIVKNIEKWIDSEYAVCLLPNNLKGKDINELIQFGMTKPKIEKLIEEYTFTGLRSKVEFSKWKQI